MADIVSDGMTKVSWVSTISNIAAPTTAELNGGVSLETFLTPDGLSIGTTTDSVDNTALSSTQNTSLVGRRNDDITLTFKDQGRSAAPWTTFASNPNGYLVVRRGVTVGTSWAASQKVSVWTAQAGYRQEVSPAANELQKFEVGLMISGAVNDAATTT